MLNPEDELPKEKKKTNVLHKKDGQKIFLNASPV
jgi:hypothetical protein